MWLWLNYRWGGKTNRPGSHWEQEGVCNKSQHVAREGLFCFQSRAVEDALPAHAPVSLLMGLEVLGKSLMSELVFCNGNLKLFLDFAGNLALDIDCGNESMLKVLDHISSWWRDRRCWLDPGANSWACGCACTMTMFSLPLPDDLILCWNHLFTICS